MALNKSSSKSPTNAQLALRGVLCVVIGLAVLFGPRFLQSERMREMVAGAYLVGWFAVVLGVALVVVGLVQQQRGKR